MKKQIPKNLDVLMVLAGEDSKDKPRSNKAVEVYHEYGRLPLLLTGSHSGMNGIHLPKGIKPLSHQMRDYILKNDVKDEDIIIENKSMDTVANFYYSRSEGLISCDTKTIGLDTDAFHMNRSLWLAKKVFRKSPEFTAVPSDYEGSPGQKMQEFILRIALRADIYGIADGDFDALTIYMRHIHPFHALAYGNKPEFSLYGFICETVRKSGIDVRAQEKAERFRG